MAIQVWDGTKYVGAELGRFGPSGTLKEALVWDGTQYVKVWPSGQSLPVVQITGTTGTVSRDQFRQACVDYGTTYQTVEVLPFQLDTSQATNVSNMFNGCTSLTSVPDMDTVNVTNMVYMFFGCSSLTQVPDLDIGNIANMTFMFYGCSSLAQVPDLDTVNVTNMSNMFNGCSSLTQVPDLETGNVTNMNNIFRNCSSLTDGNVRLIGKHPSVTTTYMIDGSGLTRLPFYDTNGDPI